MWLSSHVRSVTKWTISVRFTYDGFARQSIVHVIMLNHLLYCLSILYVIDMSRVLCSINNFIYILAVVAGLKNTYGEIMILIETEPKQI